MEPRSSQPPLTHDDPPMRPVDARRPHAEQPDHQSASRVVHPSSEEQEIVPSGSFSRQGRSQLPPEITGADPRQTPRPVRAMAGDDATEIISVLPDPSAPRHPRHRNRRTLSPGRLVGIVLVSQLALVLLGFAIFGGAIRAWVLGGAEAVPDDRLTAEQALALRDELRAANSEFAGFGSDLELVKKQVSINPGDAWKQLEILGERNQLTMLADDAIANGSRAAYDQLVTASRDSGVDQRVKDGAAAEILRVKNYYASGTRLGSYILPVATLYPSLKTAKEEALSSSQLLALLADQEKHWRVRMRAAYLLGSRRELAVSEALVRAVESDPNLDVVKECIYTFEENTGYRSKGLFEIESLVNWWTVYQARVGASSGATVDPSGGT